MFRSLLEATLLACIAIQSAGALPNISVKGAKFFANGEQFFLKGKHPSLACPLPQHMN
jgi:hypothetical protein